MNRFLTLLLLILLLVSFAYPLQGQDDDATPTVEVEQSIPPAEDLGVPDTPDDGATIEITTPVQTIILSALAAVVVIVTVFGSLFVMALRYVYKSIPQELRPSVRETVLSGVEYAKDRVALLTELPGELDDELRRLIYKAVDDRIKAVFDEPLAGLAQEIKAVIKSPDDPESPAAYG